MKNAIVEVHHHKGSVVVELVLIPFVLWLVYALVPMLTTAIVTIVGLVAAGVVGAVLAVLIAGIAIKGWWYGK